MRRLFCVDCGKIKPTHPEDAALGLFCRYMRGHLMRSVVCDQCDKQLSEGDEAVAVSQPDSMPQWENEYLMTQTSSVNAGSAAPQPTKERQ